MSNNLKPSVVRRSFSATDFKPNRGYKVGEHYGMDEVAEAAALFGVGASDRAIAAYAMDTVQANVTTPSITAPIQFLQNYAPGIIEVVTAARKIDEVIGRSTIGTFADEQVVFEEVELSGAPALYGDTTNTPYADWNLNFLTRTIVRFEQGMRVGILEQERAARVNVNSDERKRRSAAVQLEIARNAVGFYGYNSGANQTYGFLNDPGLGGYQNNPNGPWASATMLEIQEDLLTAFTLLLTQSNGVIDPQGPNGAPTTVAIAQASEPYLGVTSDFGYSVRAWLRDTYPNARVVSVPQLTGANSSANVFYISADEVIDSGTDDQKVWIQPVPSSFQLLGVQKLIKGYEESYANATAGAVCKRPYAVVRFTGI